MANSPIKASNPSPSIPKSSGNQRVSDMYDAPDEQAGEGAEAAEPKPTTGDYISNAASKASQDVQDLDTVSGGKVSEGIRDKANEIKDRYFPGKKDDEEGEGEGEEQGEGEDKDKEGDNSDDANSKNQGNAGKDGSGQEIDPKEDSSGERGEKNNKGKPSEGKDAQAKRDEPSPADQPGKGASSTADTAQKAGGAVDTGGKVADTGQKVAGAAEKGEQIADATQKTAQVGEVLAEGGELAAEAEIGGATAGTGAAVIEGAKAAYKGAKAAYNFVKKGLQLKERAEAAGRLFKRWWWCGCIVFIPLIIMVGAFWYVYENILHLDTLSKIGQRIVSIFKGNRSTGMVAFTNPSSADAIEKGEVGKNAATALGGIALDKKSTVNLVGNSPITGRQNEAYEFDLLTYDTIKCAFAGEKLSEISIDLSPASDWQARIIPGKEAARCAVGYYPGIDSPASNKFSGVGPGEFNLSDIASSGTKAAAQSSLEVIEKIAKANSDAVKDDDQVPLNQIILSTEVYQLISSNLVALLSSYYPDSPAEKMVERQPGAPGIHFDFGISVSSFND